MKTSHQALVCAAVAVLSWSTVATAFKLALQQLTYFELIVIASLTALLLFGLTLTVRHQWPLVARLSRRQWGRFAFLGLLNPVCYYLVLFRSYELLPAQVAQPVNYAWPIVLLLLLALFGHQPIPRSKYGGMAVSLAGVALISAGTGGTSGLSVSATGLLLALLSAFLWALYWMMTNRREATVDGTVSLFMTFLFGSLYLLAATAVVGLHTPTLTGWLSGIYVGCFEMGVPFLCFGLAIRTTDNPTLVNQLCYLSPFLSLFFIGIVLGEPIAVTTYIGLLLILGGLLLNRHH